MKEKARTITKIKYDGEEVHQQELIQKGFMDFYKKLYANEGIPLMDVDQYLQEVTYNKISEEQQKQIEITEEEIVMAINQRKVGKTPGTDGLTAVYYKVLAEELVEPMKDLFNGILNEGGVPQSWSTAFISLIPKEEQDLCQPKHYRPISLLNTDYKILQRFWANGHFTRPQ